MGTCPIDHSVEDVRKKLEEQSPYLPEGLIQDLRSFLNQDLSQETLNDTFHLLKKYDLANDAEREKRNMQFEAILDTTTKS